MSFFHDNTDQLKDFIGFFNDLDNVRKAVVVGSVSKTGATYTDEEIKHIIPIIEAIEHDLITHSEITIANKIIECGMDNTYAQLFVKNIVDSRPPIEYHLNILERMDEKSFKDMFLNTIKGFYFDLEPKEKLLEKLKITDQQFSAITNAYVEAVFEILRGEVNLNLIREKASTVIKSEKKLNAMEECLQSTSDLIGKRVMFYDIQETYLATQEVVEQNKVILTTLREILEILKSK